MLAAFQLFCKILSWIWFPFMLVLFLITEKGGKVETFPNDKYPPEKTGVNSLL